MRKVFKTFIGCIIVIGFILPISSCEKSGCTNPLASNYNASATKDDGSCKIPGCTDPTALNYSSTANVNNGTCIYPANGQVIFWYNSAGTNATVNIDGQQGTITEYYSSGTPSCGAAGCATFSLPPGTYAFTASSSLSNWSGNVTVTSNNCLTWLLY